MIRNFSFKTKANVAGLFSSIFILLVPTAKLGYESLSTWGDQILFLNSQKEFEESGTSSSFTKGLVGPGYSILVRIFELGTSSPEIGLVLLSIASFSIIYFVLTRLMFEIKEINVLFLSIVVVSSYFLLGIIFVKDVPWTHFPAAALVILINYLLIDGKQNKAKSTCIGILFGFLLQLRAFESLAFLTAVAIYFSLKKFLYKKERFFKVAFPFLLYSVGAALLTSYSISRIANSNFWFKQYSGLVPKQDFSIMRMINRCIQLFYNPSFNALPDSTDFTWFNVFSGFKAVAENEINVQDYFNSPLSLQQPLLIPLNVIAISLIIMYLLPKYRNLENAEFIWISATSAIIIQAGYLTNPFTSGGTLRYLIFREFLLPQFLIILAIILHLKASHSLLTLRKITIFLGISILLSVSLSLFPKPQLANYDSYKWVLNDENCKSIGSCSISVTALRNGKIHKISPQPIEVRARCDGQIFRWYEEEFIIHYNAFCNVEPEEIEVLPLFFGNAGTPAGESYFRGI